MLLKKIIISLFLLMAFNCQAVTKGAAFAACAAVVASHTPNYFGSWTCRAVVGSWAGLSNESGSVYLGNDLNPQAGAGWFAMGYAGFDPCTPPGVLSVATGSCNTPTCTKPICTGEQNPFTTNCKYPVNAPIVLNCTDGSTVNVPGVCPSSKWDLLFSPRQGESATCSDGSVIGYGSNCLDRFVKRNIIDSKNPAVAAGAIFLGGVIGGGAKPVLTLVGTVMKMVFPIGVKTVGQEVALTTGRTELSTAETGNALANYIKSNPTSSYANSLKTAIAANGANNPVTIDGNTGAVMSSCSTVPFSNNQLAKVALAAGSVAPIPFTELEPFVNLGNMPWVEPAINALQEEYRGVMIQPYASPSNFPLASSALPNSSIIIDVNPNSPITYPINKSPNPTQPPTAPPGTTIPPANDIVVPDKPVLYPDTYKYFDFLPSTNPFSFDPLKYMPGLPTASGCTYEIHQVIHLPLLGDKNFDIAPCAKLAPLRAVLKWAFAVLTTMTCFFIIFRSAFST